MEIITTQKAQRERQWAERTCHLFWGFVCWLFLLLIVAHGCQAFLGGCVKIGGEGELSCPNTISWRLSKLSSSTIAAYFFVVSKSTVMQTNIWVPLPLPPAVCYCGELDEGEWWMQSWDNKAQLCVRELCKLALALGLSLLLHLSLCSLGNLLRTFRAERQSGTLLRLTRTAHVTALYEQQGHSKFTFIYSHLANLFIRSAKGHLPIVHPSVIIRNSELSLVMRAHCGMTIDFITGFSSRPARGALTFRGSGRPIWQLSEFLIPFYICFLGPLSSAHDKVIVNVCLFSIIRPPCPAF